jgi:hypothetical protein
MKTGLEDAIRRREPLCWARMAAARRGTRGQSGTPVSNAALSRINVRVAIVAPLFIYPTLILVDSAAAWVAY